MPMDIEWAKDGLSGQLFIVQARPETVQSRKNPNLLKTFKIKGEGKVITKGNIDFIFSRSELKFI